MSDLEFYMEDICDYLMENDFNIGTNFKEEFPNSVAHNGIIELKDENYKTKYILRMERTANDWERYIQYLISWAKDHKDEEYKGMSPACYDEFLENDDEDCLNDMED